MEVPFNGYSASDSLAAKSLSCKQTVKTAKKEISLQLDPGRAGDEVHEAYDLMKSSERILKHRPNFRSFCPFRFKCSYVLCPLLFVYFKRTNKSLTFSAIFFHKVFLVDVQVIPLKATPYAAWALSWVQSPRRGEMLSIVPHRSKEKSNLSKSSPVVHNH